MKKLLGCLMLVLMFGLLNVSSASASVENVSATTNKVNDDMKVYVKNSSNTKNKYVTVELQLNGKTVDSKKVKVDSDRRKTVDFELKDSGKYSIKTTVDKKSQKTEKGYKK